MSLKIQKIASKFKQEIILPQKVRVISYVNYFCFPSKLDNLPIKIINVIISKTKFNSTLILWHKLRVAIKIHITHFTRIFNFNDHLIS